MMAAVAPFEASPRLAVAVSGGGDSMALCLLADAWARARGGSVSALTVDHGLRPESSKEAAQVGRWLAQRRIEHHILSWPGAKPATGVQAWARGVRYGLMTSWAAEAGALHLLLAHNMEDQAETFLMRLARGSGVDGLSSMSAVVETPSARLARPLLGVSGERLRNTLREQGQDWIEDASNRNPRFARTEARAAVKRLAGKGIAPERLAAAARRLGQARLIMEAAVSALLARCCAFHPAGHAYLDAAILTSAPAPASFRALARVLMCVGGGAYPPRREKMARLHDQITGGAFEGARTLGGCRIIPPGQGTENTRILVCREGRGMPEPVAAVPGARVLWDGRFAVEFNATQASDDQASLSCLGRNGWDEIASELEKTRFCAIPPAARASLPALRDGKGVVAVPHLKYRRDGGNPSTANIKRITFHPQNSASGAGFVLV